LKLQRLKTPEINTVDVYVFYFQTTFNFPSWQAERSERARVN